VKFSGRPHGANPFQYGISDCGRYTIARVMVGGVATFEPFRVEPDGHPATEAVRLATGCRTIAAAASICEADAAMIARQSAAIQTTKEVQQ